MTTLTASEAADAHQLGASYAAGAFDLTATEVRAVYAALVMGRHVILADDLATPLNVRVRRIGEWLREEALEDLRAEVTHEHRPSERWWGFRSGGSLRWTSTSSSTVPDLSPAARIR